MGCWNYWGWMGRISPVFQTDASAGLLENGLEAEKPGARRWNDMSMGMTDGRNFSERRIWSWGSQRWGFGKKNKNVQRGKVQAPKLRNSRNYDQYVYSAFTSSGFHTTSWYPPHHRPKADKAQNLMQMTKGSGKPTQGHMACEQWDWTGPEILMLGPGLGWQC